MFRKLAERFEAIELQGELPPHRDRLTLRAPTAVPLKLRSTSQSAPLAARPAGDDAEWRIAYRDHIDNDSVQLDDRGLESRIALLKRVPFFAPCTEVHLAALAATAYPLAFDQGEHLCVEGSEAPDLYVIAAGEADVIVAGRTIAVVGADDVIGERGVILGATRAATVTAASHMITFAISRELLENVLATSPEVLAAMRESVQQRYS